MCISRTCNRTRMWHIHSTELNICGDRMIKWHRRTVPHQQCTELDGSSPLLWMCRILVRPRNQNIFHTWTTTPELTWRTWLYRPEIHSPTVHGTRDSWYRTNIMMYFSSRGRTPDFLIRKFLIFPLDQVSLDSDLMTLGQVGRLRTSWPGSSLH